jgi:hypothetical protein
MLASGEMGKVDFEKLSQGRESRHAVPLAFLKMRKEMSYPTPLPGAVCPSAKESGGDGLHEISPSSSSTASASVSRASMVARSWSGTPTSRSKLIIDTPQADLRT